MIAVEPNRDPVSVLRKVAHTLAKLDPLDEQRALAPEPDVK